MKTHPTCFDVEDHPTWKVVTLVIVSPRVVGYTVLLMANPVANHSKWDVPPSISITPHQRRPSSYRLVYTPIN